MYPTPAARTHIKGDPTYQKIGRSLNNAGTSKHHPVRQPLSVVIGIVRVNCLEGGVGGVHEADEVGNKLGTPKSKEGESNGQHGNKEEVNLTVPELLLSRTEQICMNLF